MHPFLPIPFQFHEPHVLEILFPLLRGRTCCDLSSRLSHARSGAIVVNIPGSTRSTLHVDPKHSALKTHSTLGEFVLKAFKVFEHVKIVTDVGIASQPSASPTDICEHRSFRRANTIEPAEE